MESEEKNASGDNPKKIDIYAHNLLVENLKSTNLVSKIGSEESEELIECGDFISNKVYDVYHRNIMFSCSRLNVFSY